MHKQLYKIFAEAKHSKAQHGKAQDSTAKHRTAQHGKTQDRTAQHSTAQGSPAQYGIAQLILNCTSAQLVYLINEHHGVAGPCGLEALHHLPWHCSHVRASVPCMYDHPMFCAHRAVAWWIICKRQGGGPGNKIYSFVWF